MEQAMQKTSADRIRISLLGHFDIQPLPVKGRTQKQLLALLVLARRQPEFQINGEVSREWLAENLYPEDYTKNREQARNCLSKVVNGLTCKVGNKLDVHNNHL